MSIAGHTCSLLQTAAPVAIQVATPCTVETLAQLVDLVKAQALEPTRRGRICSGLATIAKVLDRPLHEVPAERLAPLLRQANPARVGVGVGRWNNARSNLYAALEIGGLVDPAGNPKTPLAPDWVLLWQLLPNESFRRGLVYLMRYCSARGVPPNAVDQSLFDALLAHLQGNVRVDRWREQHRQACKLWNKAADSIANWPTFRVSVPLYKQSYIVPWSIFPPSLRADLENYLQQRIKPNLLAKKPAKRIKHSTRNQIERWVHRFASQLKRCGVDPASLTRLADLVSLENYERGLEAFLGRNGGDTSAQTNNIAQALKVIAKEWVGYNDDQMDEIARLRKQVRESRFGLTEKNLARLRVLIEPENRNRLLQLPQTLAKAARSTKLGMRHRAMLMQMALAIEILLICPMRLGNLAALDRKRHIIDIVPGGKKRLIMIPGAEVKNLVPIDRPLSVQAIALLDEYWAHYRPSLVDGPSGAVFPGKAGAPKDTLTLGQQISSVIYDYSGLEMNPHLFRHFAAWNYLRAFPGDYETVRQFLGHRSIATTIAFYTGIEGVAAFERYDRLLAARVTPRNCRRRFEVGHGRDRQMCPERE